jgi:hypothetical protein
LAPQRGQKWALARKLIFVTLARRNGSEFSALTNCRRIVGFYFNN